MEVERITTMETLSNEQKEHIIVDAYTKDMFDHIFYYTLGINCILKHLNYSDRLTINIDKGIFEWSTIHDH